MPEQKQKASARINPESLFRMPWTMSDNSLTWLEPTRKCNITCDACFASNDPHSDKSLAQINHEVETMLKFRRCDGMLIAGGEPLTHPQIMDVVAIVKKHKIKPILLTNGVDLNPGMISDLKKAGLFGFTFHIDSHQDRPKWIGKNEKDLNSLRQELADMVYEEKGMVCGFNMTVFPDTLQEVPDVVEFSLIP
jgi:MoaA/NifB/PqqE/SkfB family radical SAM enzyme